MGDKSKKKNAWPQPRESTRALHVFIETIHGPSHAVKQTLRQYVWKYVIDFFFFTKSPFHQNVYH